MTRGDTERIGDIWDRIIAARTAELYLVAAESAEDNGLVGVAFDAILYDLLVIGEAVKALSPECRERRTMDQPLTVLEAACLSESTA